MVHFRVMWTASTRAGWRVILTGGSQSALAMDYSECTSVESLFTGGVNVWIHYPLLILKLFTGVLLVISATNSSIFTLNLSSTTLIQWVSVIIMYCIVDQLAGYNYSLSLLSLSCTHTRSLSHSLSSPSLPSILCYPSLISWRYLTLFIWQLNITSVGEVVVSMSIVYDTHLWYMCTICGWTHSYYLLHKSTYRA